MNFFNRSKGKVLVGPLLYKIYESLDSKSKVAFKDFVKGASTKREMVATIPSINIDVAQAIMLQLQRVPTGKNSVKGSAGKGDGYIFYVSGDFPDSVRNDLAILFNNFAMRANVEPTILQGSPSAGQLKELP